MGYTASRVVSNYALCSYKLIALHQSMLYSVKDYCSLTNYALCICEIIVLLYSVFCAAVNSVERNMVCFMQL